jgi:large subunit ribosomal protein L29
MMKAAELREKSMDELVKQVEDLKEELFNLRFQHATHQLEDTSRIRQVRRSIARAKTVLREKVLKSS